MPIWSYEVRRNYRSPGFERPKKVLTSPTPNDLNESCLEPYVNFKMLLPRWNQSWWCRCSFDKLYLWTITCGLVSVLTRQIICPAPTGQSQRLSGQGPPTLIMSECPVPWAVIGQRLESWPLIGPLSGCHMCEGILSVISVTAVHQIQTQL